jgi:hypothetical protein
MLFTLRHRDAVKNLEKFVSKVRAIKAKGAEKRILLLVDGYDEISTTQRKRVSELLIQFSIRGVGEWYLTCRDHYEIYDLNAPRLKIAEFEIEDQIRFVETFLRAYGSAANATKLVKELHDRGLYDLLRHPLLLTLACIVKNSSLDVHSRNVVSLIDAAINTLSFRWDESKGLKREGTTPLDSIARIKCLKRIAFTLGLEPARQHTVVEIARKQLELMRWEQVDPLQVLLEIARFYGIFVPVGDSWGFVHRSLQDFLAAQYWVGTGQFARDTESGEFRLDSRTAFAGCLMDDATSVMESALRRKEGLPIFAEMLMNDPSFDHSAIAKAIVAYYTRYETEHYYRRTDYSVECHLQQDFITDASSKFLDYLVQVCATTRGKTKDTLTAYATSELALRGVPLSQLAYEICIKNFGSEKFSFVASNRQIVRLIDVCPKSNIPDRVRPPKV